jgi:hypothetical protein
LPRIVVLVLLLLGVTPAAHAGTTVYATSVYAQSGAVANAGQAIGAPDALAATLTKPLFGQSPVLILYFAQPLTGATMSIAGTATGIFSQVRVSIGDIVNGVATFAAQDVVLPNNTPMHAIDMTAACSSIVGANGSCSLLRFSIAGLAGSFTLNSVGGAPEPAAWMLMILGFLMVGARMKQERWRPACAAARNRR